MAQELKEQDRRELEYVLKNIFSSTSNEYSQVKSMVKQEHIGDIHQITSLSNEDIEGLTYLERPEDGSSTSTIPRWMIARIQIGLALLLCQVQEREPSDTMDGVETGRCGGILPSV